MPTISIFFGIIIQMHWRDHAPPHLHAWYQGEEALIDLATGEILAGRLKRKPLRIVQDWIDEHREELMENWKRGERQQPFEMIPGADE